MKTIDIIESVLQNDSYARNNDRYLLLRVWERQGLYLTFTQQEKFHEVASAESIRRTRQKLQEDGKYPANDLVSSHRRFKGALVQQLIPNIAAERVETILDQRSLL